MKKVIFLLVFLWLISCHEKPAESIVSRTGKPFTVSGDGIRIHFTDTASANFFKTVGVKNSQLNTTFSAPGRVVATVVPSVEITGQNLILFDNPELTANYTALLQHLINIRTYSSNLERLKDLAEHGAATGREVIEAENQLANEKAGILEHEAKLKLAGLEPQALLKSKSNSVWIISDIPETQLQNIKTGLSCKVRFNSFPEKEFTGKIEDWGNTVDPVTRMVKLRVSANNPSNLLKAGMFATLAFDTNNNTWLTVPKEAVVTVQGKYYAFAKTGEQTFERREIQVGDQLQDNIVVFGGLNENEQVVSNGTMQLKGISFGY